MPTFNYSDPGSLSVDSYRNWFQQHVKTIPGNVTECDLEKEMQKVRNTLLEL